MANNQEWLDGLKKGDKVAITSRHPTRIEVVTHTTPHFIHVDNRKFRRRSGTEVSDLVWDSYSIEEPTQAHRDEVERVQLNQLVRNLPRLRLSIDQKRRIAAIAKEVSDGNS